MSRKIILLADDDIDDRDMFCEALEKIDTELTCHATTNGMEAIQVLEQLDQQPDVIFLDLNMPVMNGWQCLSFLKEQQQYKNIPVIMISTSSHQSDIDKANNSGALCYLVKPSNFRELSRVLQVIVDHLDTGLSAALQELQQSSAKIIFACNKTV